MKPSPRRRRLVIAFWWIWLAIGLDNTAHLIEEKGVGYILDYLWIAIGTLIGSFWRDRRQRRRRPHGR
jgi:hypothetical protein